MVELYKTGGFECLEKLCNSTRVSEDAASYPVGQGHVLMHTHQPLLFPKGWQVSSPFQPLSCCLGFQKAETGVQGLKVFSGTVKGSVLMMMAGGGACQP